MPESQMKRFVPETVKKPHGDCGIRTIGRIERDKPVETWVLHDLQGQDVDQFLDQHFRRQKLRVMKGKGKE